MQTIGERLEDARKKKGISIREAADATKIRGDYLQKFEGNHFDIGLTDKRVGQYFNDNKTLKYTINGATIPVPVNNAVSINPWNLTNLFFNYTIKNQSHFRGTKIQLAINNLANSHAIVGVTAANGGTIAVPYVQSPSDLINLLPGRSFSLTITGGYAPRR